MFASFAARVSEWAASSFAFGLAFALIVVWALAGPFFLFSDGWSLAINTITTIITFLMVFLLQNSQTRDAKAMQVKIDELIRAVDKARNDLIGIEKRPEEVDREYGA